VIRGAVLPLVILAVLTRGLAAQDSTAVARDSMVDSTGVEADDTNEVYRAPWRTSYFPYLTGAPNDGPALAAGIRYFQPAEYEARYTNVAKLSLDAGLTGRGSRAAIAQFKAPGLWKDWRIYALAGADRQARYGYFGLGENTIYDKDLVGDGTPFLYRVRRTRYRGVAEVTRVIRGPWMAAFQASVEQVRFTSLPGSSAFTTDFPSGEIEQNDAAGRLALIYDTRDIEYNTHRGLLLEAGTQVGSGGEGNGYTHQYVMLRGWLPVREGTVVAARLAGSGMGGHPTLNSRFAIPGWEHSVPVLGGEYSHRSFDTGRFTGRGSLFANLEVRHDLLPFGDLGAITLLAFIDGGRVFEQSGFRLTTDDWKVGGGGGFAIRILRSTIITFNFAGGPDGFNYSVGNGWAF
jgi:outer membrane protein assembly factor BamA